MTDVFNRNIGYAGSILPEQTMFTDLAGLASGLVTGVQCEYTQQLSRMWSLFGVHWQYSFSWWRTIS